MVDLEAIDGMIDAGWKVLRSDFDEAAFLVWRQRVCECIESLLGSKHAYNQYFKRCSSSEERRSVLAGCGILCAVKEAATDGQTPSARELLVMKMPAQPLRKHA